MDKKLEPVYVNNGYYLSVTQCADRYNINRSSVIKACKLKWIASYTVGNTYIVPFGAAEARWGKQDVDDEQQI